MSVRADTAIVRASANLSWRDGRIRRTATATIALRLEPGEIALVDAETFRPVDRVDIALAHDSWLVTPLVQPRDGVERYVAATVELGPLLDRLSRALDERDLYVLGEMFGLDPSDRITRVLRGQLAPTGDDIDEDIW